MNETRRDLEISRSLIILVKEVLVEQWVQKPDCSELGE